MEVSDKAVLVRIQGGLILFLSVDWCPQGIPILSIDRYREAKDAATLGFISGPDMSTMSFYDDFANIKSQSGTLDGFCEFIPDPVINGVPAELAA